MQKINQIEVFSVIWQGFILLTGGYFLNAITGVTMPVAIASMCLCYVASKCFQVVQLQVSTRAEKLENQALLRESHATDVRNLSETISDLKQRLSDREHAHSVELANRDTRITTLEQQVSELEMALRESTASRQEKEDAAIFAQINELVHSSEMKSENKNIRWIISSLESAIAASVRNSQNAKKGGSND